LGDFSAVYPRTLVKGGSSSSFSPIFLKYYCRLVKK
jgi:hypothetical protein